MKIIIKQLKDDAIVELRAEDLRFTCPGMPCCSRDSMTFFYGLAPWHDGAWAEWDNRPIPIRHLVEAL